MTNELHDERMLEINKQINGLGPEAHTLKGIVAEILTLKCNLCQTRGHTAKECGFKKRVDKAVKTLPIAKKIWGNYKSQFKVNGK